jgi:hypothetical protein
MKSKQLLSFVRSLCSTTIAFLKINTTRESVELIFKRLETIVPQLL